MPQNILKSMSQHKMSTGVIIIAIAGLGYLAYNALPKGGNAVRYVTAIVEKGTLIVSVSGSGNVVAQDSADINPGISGTVAAIKVSLGDAVEKGQILAVIKNDDLDIKKESAFSALNIAKEAVKKAKLDRTQKYQDLYDLQAKQKSSPDSVSDLDIKLAAQKVRDADLAIQSAEIKVKAANLDYAKAKDDADLRSVKATISGKVTAMNIKIGDEIVSGTSTSAASATKSATSLMTIVNLDKLSAQISLNEIDAAKVKPDQKTTLTFDAVGGLTLTGIVTDIDNLGTVTQGVVTYQVNVAIDSGEPRVKPGMSVSAAIVTDIKQDVLIVPNSAVKLQGDLHYVEIFDQGLPQSQGSQGAASPVPPREKSVEIGLSNDTSTEIVSGLNAGDQVVVRTITGQAAQSTGQQAPSLFGGAGGRGATTGNNAIRIPR